MSNKGGGHMRIISLTNKEFAKLEKYHIQNSILNTEANFYLLNKKEKWNLVTYLLKYLHIQANEEFANKLLTVSMLGDKGKELEVEELVIPEHLVAIDNVACSFTSRLEKGDNLGIILQNPKISNEEKLYYLYKVGNVVKKVQNNCKHVMPFHFGDLHPYNFLIERDTEKLHVVDLDSAYLETTYPAPSYYLCKNKKNLRNLPEKYHIHENDMIIPNNNTDLFCYNTMVLETIARENISIVGMEMYYDYLKYLKDLGFGENIINSFERLYWPNENISAYEYFDEIPINKIGQAGMKVYRATKK